MAGTTRLELATSDVTGRRSNQTELRPRKLNRFVVCDPLDYPSSIDKWQSASCHRQDDLQLFSTYHAESVVGGTGIEPVTFGL